MHAVTEWPAMRHWCGCQIPHYFVLTIYSCWSQYKFGSGPRPGSAAATFGLVLAVERNASNPKDAIDYLDFSVKTDPDNFVILTQLAIHEFWRFKVSGKQFENFY